MLLLGLLVACSLPVEPMVDRSTTPISGPRPAADHDARIDAAPASATSTLPPATPSALVSRRSTSADTSRLFSHLEHDDLAIIDAETLNLVGHIAMAGLETSPAWSPMVAVTSDAAP